MPTLSEIVTKYHVPPNLKLLLCKNKLLIKKLLREVYFTKTSE